MGKKEEDEIEKVITQLVSELGEHLPKLTVNHNSNGDYRH